MVFATVTIYFVGIWLQNIQNTGDRYLKDNKETLSREDKKAYIKALEERKDGCCSLYFFWILEC